MERKTFGTMSTSSSESGSSSEPLNSKSKEKSVSLFQTNRYIHIHFYRTIEYSLLYKINALYTSSTFSVIHDILIDRTNLIFYIL